MKKHVQLILIFFISITTVFSQIDDITKFYLPDTSISIEYSTSVFTDNKYLIFFWADSNVLYYSRTNDYGQNWETPKIITEDLKSITGNVDLAAVKLDNGRLLLSYKAKGHYLRYSDTHGLNWSDPIELPTGSPIQKQYFGCSSYFTDADNNVYFNYSMYFTSGNLRGNTFSIKSNDGINWSSARDTVLLTSPIASGNVVLIPKEDDKLLLVYQLDSTGQFDIYSAVVDTSFNILEPPKNITNNISNDTNPNLVRTDDGNTWLIYETEMETNIPGVITKEIIYRVSSDEGNSWSEIQKFTDYGGDDFNHSVVVANNNNPVILFSSLRPNIQEPRPGFSSTQLYHQNIPASLWYGIPGLSEDNLTPPLFYEYDIQYDILYPTVDVIWKTQLFEDDIMNVKVDYSLNNADYFTLELNDDGINGDDEPDDYVYSGMLDDFYISDSITFRLVSEDLLGNKVETPFLKTIPTFPDTTKAYLVDVNNILLPISNRGFLAGVNVLFPDGITRQNGIYNDHSFLYSGGFYLGGLYDDKIWANAMAYSSRNQDYLAGTFGSNPNDFRNSIYIIKSSDEPFGKSWQNWGFAVDLGARFYDGNGDGVYNPVDLNSNGTWDPNEDKPDIIGDVTAWCVYNDGMDPALRRYVNVNPLGIEIRQTVFGYLPYTFPELTDVLFIRYEIKNTGLVAPKLEQCIFGAWSDPDIGDYQDDLVGCDINLNSGITYSKGNDAVYGNSPAFFTTIVQGPHAYVPGETFIDNNSNGSFDSDIDTPLDSAYIRFGDQFDEILLPGSRNRRMSSYIHYIASHPLLGSPSNEKEAYNYLQGLNREGEVINPCTWGFGEVHGEIDCSVINPVYLYSGDPVTDVGWICTYAFDQSEMTNTGPFTLNAGETVTIIIAYVVGRGTTSLESINVARDIVRKVHGFYSTNFTELIVDVENTTNNQLPTTFKLYQNYPNPFNPTTIIKFTIPLLGGAGGGLIPVSIKLFDILGREIKTLVNKPHTPGNYEIEFDGSNLASGVYFYRLNAGDFISTKKMMLLR